MICRKKYAISKLKKELPLLQAVAFRDLYSDPTRFFGTEPVFGSSFDFLRNVDRVLLEEPVFKKVRCACGIRTFGTPELFPDNEDDKFEGKFA